jgi:hypothetical protein
VQFGKETDLTDPVAGALPSPQLIVAVKLGGFEDPVLVKVAGQTVADSVKCPASPVFSLGFEGWAVCLT